MAPHQLGFTDTPIIELDGTLAPSATGLFITAGSSTVRGLVINRFVTGISISISGNNLIEGNFIGTDVTGTAASGNSVALLINAPNNTIGGTTPGAGNIISGNIGVGSILISGSNNIVRGNVIGTQVDGCPFMGWTAGILLANSLFAAAEREAEPLYTMPDSSG